jgi:hypothetical protein
LLVRTGNVSHDGLRAREADSLRIREHLRGVESELRTKPVANLTLEQRQARARVLDTLHEYWLAGVFPENTHHHGERVPYFIDDAGRACAMAHLMQMSGHEDLAAGVASEENNSRVLDMKTDLGPWLSEHGMSADEAARVQPSYCSCGNEENPVCGSIEVDGRTEDLTFLNRCVADLCAGATNLRAGKCAATDEPTADFPDCACEDTGGCECSAPGMTRHVGAWGVLLMASGALSLFARRRRRR